MFVDIVKLELSSGKGGEGCTSFRKEKFVVKGGPDGGDGGKGGDLILEVCNNTDTLSSFKGKKKLKAKDGEPGGGSRCSGKAGENLILRVPPGTQVFDDDTDELLLDLLEDGQRLKLITGGKGGMGNYHFKNSRNQTPTYHQPGLPATTLNVRFELKLIADVGLVGFPNVGKSTLISTISNAKPQIANYEFTTLIPNLGVVSSGEYSSFVMADIPGIIEGASCGKGLGLEFLRHIQRTKTVLFVLDISNYKDMQEQYRSLKIELQRYSKELVENRYAIVLTKIDTMTTTIANKKIDIFLKYLNIKKTTKQKFALDMNYNYFLQNDDNFEFTYDNDKPYFVLPISSATNTNTKAVVFALQEMLDVEL